MRKIILFVSGVFFVVFAFAFVQIAIEKDPTAFIAAIVCIGISCLCFRGLRKKKYLILEQFNKSKEKHFAIAYQNDLSTISILKQSDIDDIIKTVIKCKFGQDRGKLHPYVYEKYFQGKAWIWPEFEYWKAHGLKTDEWPTGVNLQLRQKNTVGETRKKIIFNMLMSTMLCRAGSLCTRAISPDVEHCHVEKKDSKLMEIALKENPRAIPPLLPNGMDSWRAKIS